MHDVGKDQTQSYCELKKYLIKLSKIILNWYSFFKDISFGIELLSLKV